jgi:hypothetical protein
MRYYTSEIHAWIGLCMDSLPARCLLLGLCECCVAHSILRCGSKRLNRLVTVSIVGPNFCSFIICYKQHLLAVCLFILGGLRTGAPNVPNCLAVCMKASSNLSTPVYLFFLFSVHIAYESTFAHSILDIEFRSYVDQQNKP